MECDVSVYPMLDDEGQRRGKLRQTSVLLIVDA